MDVMNDSKKITTITWVHLKITSVKSFLALCTYYRKFISIFTDIAKPLTRSKEKKQALWWSPEVQTAFQSLKKALCTEPILGYMHPGDKSSADTDMSKPITVRITTRQKLLRYLVGPTCHCEDTGTLP
jgi:hypothetical protein